MIILLSVAVLILFAFITGKLIVARQFKKEVKELFAQSKNISATTFSYNQLTGLPEPVQRYFKYVLQEGQSYISFISLIHNGQFKAGLKKDWVNIKGEQYFTTEKPGYIWKGQTSVFTARDMYIGNKGRLIVSLFSAVNIQDQSGAEFDQGELLRWLAESVWFPTNLLPSDRLQWLPIDSHTAKLLFNYNGLSLYFIVSFNDKGEIVTLESQRNITKTKQEKWVCTLGDYRTTNGIKVPFDTVATWRLAGGDLPYARFKVQKITYHHSTEGFQ